MTRWWKPLFAASLLTAGAALAQDEPDPGVEDDMELVTRGEHAPLVMPEGWDNPMDRADTVEEFRDLPYEAEAYRGADQLGLNPEYIHEVRTGLELFYRRDYSGARDHFVGVEERFPGTGIGAVVQVLTWQAVMLENWDFRFDKQYWVASARARTELEAALDVEGNEGLEHFLMAGVVGIEAIHTMRREKYLGALQLAFDAMDHISKAREAAPDFVDLKIADGIYHYWRTVVTMNSSVLPDYGDHREQGIEEMREVATEGIFMAPPARMSLAFAFIEERQLKLANGECAKLNRAYPDSIINLLIYGQIQVYMRRYDNAVGLYDRILEVDADNRRVHYWKGLALMRSGDKAAAITEFEQYLESEYLEDYHRASTHYRLGQAYYRSKQYAEAEAEYKKAQKLTGHRGSRAALDRMKRAKKEGRIDY